MKKKHNNIIFFWREEHKKEKNEKTHDHKKERRENTETMKWNDKKWHGTAWCNGWPAADVRVLATTEQTTIHERSQKKGKQDEKNSVS